MTEEQRYVIKYLYDSGKPKPAIITEIREHYGDEALSITQIYYWLRKVRLGETDLSDRGHPGRTPDESLAAVIAAKHERDRHLSARKLAKSLGISPTTVCHYFTDVLGLKLRHMRWVPHTLTLEQKDKRAQLAGSMLIALEKHRASGFHFMFTGDESWLFYHYERECVWAASWEDIGEIERPSHHQKKTMMTVFFNGSGAFSINLLPQGQKMNSNYFAENIIRPLSALCYPNGRQAHERRVSLHFDNAPIHNTKVVDDAIGSLGLKKLEHPPYSPDLAPCDFFLFGHVKGRLNGCSFATPDEIFAAVQEVINEIPPDVFARVFEEWLARLRTCRDSGGEYVE
jgi:histone-lysine N-methyltransferase SETMAR